MQIIFVILTFRQNTFLYKQIKEKQCCLYFLTSGIDFSFSVAVLHKHILSRFLILRFKKDEYVHHLIFNEEIYRSILYIIIHNKYIINAYTSSLRYESNDISEQNQVKHNLPYWCLNCSPVALCLRLVF